MSNEPTSPKKPLLFIVDDAQSNLDIMSAFLRHDYELETALSGMDTLDRLDEAQPEVYCFLLDIAMPQMDGNELLGRIRSSEKYAGVPAIAVTAHCEPQEVREMMRSGFQAYMPKPVDFTMLKRMIHRIDMRTFSRISRPGLFAKRPDQKKRLLIPPNPGISA